MKIRVWWLNRALLYWIPAIFIYYSIATALRQDVGSAMTNATIAALIVLFFEHFLFSYKIDLTATTLLYSEGLLFRKKSAIEHNDIESASFLQTPILAKLQSARLALTIRGGDYFVVSLAAFRPADIAKIIDWLPVKPASKR